MKSNALMTASPARQLWREARVEPCLDAREDQLAAAVAALQPNKDGREEAVKR